MALEIQHKTLTLPPLSSVVEVLKLGLSSRYESVHVEIATNPVNFYNPPYSLANESLNGTTSCFEFGGVPCLCPVALQEKQYDLEKVATQLNFPPGTLFIGAGAGPYHHTKRGSEASFNYRTGGANPTKALNRGYLAECEATAPNGFHSITWPEYAKPVCCDFIGHLLSVAPNNEAPNQLIHITAKRRIPLDGKEWNGNFIGAIRESLAARFDPVTQPLGLGGTFLITDGKIQIHVMPNTPPTKENPVPITELMSFLKHFKCPSPQTCVGILFTSDMGLGLFPEHFHCWGPNGEGGHYELDITPDEIAYDGYFVLAQNVYKVV
jgi:hypothetical protein